MTPSEWVSAAALAAGVVGHSTIESPNGDALSARSVADFLRTLFRLLDESEVRYCVLHSWFSLPEKLPSDLDLAVHPLDRMRLPAVFEALGQRGYAPIQWRNYVTNGHGFYFIWRTDSSVSTATLDIIFEHRRGGLILAAGDELVRGRMRHGPFWVSSPKVEFAYLLAKKIWKRAGSPSQFLRLAHLVQQLGAVEAERIAAEFLPRSWKTRVVEICATGTIETELDDLHRDLWHNGVSRRPLRMIRHLTDECRRGVRRIIQPTGILVSVLGPDGVGKSTLIEGLPDAFGASFLRRRVFHWRPEAFSRRRNNRSVTDPHGQVPRGTLISMAYLAAFFVDSWIGYLIRVRPLLAGSGLVQFDRYFHDVLVDPQRYRYGGPKWFAALLCRLLPEPDLVILLDAEEDLILERKTELTRAEIQHQRELYRRLKFLRAREVCVRTDAGIEATLQASTSAVVEFMKQRFGKRIGDWMREVS